MVAREIDSEAPSYNPQEWASPGFNTNSKVIQRSSTPVQTDSIAAQPRSTPIPGPSKVTQRDIMPTQPGHQRREKVKQSAIFSGQSIDRKRPYFEMAVGITLLIISFGSTIATFNGSWSLRPTLFAIVTGLGLQLIATMTEWFWRRDRFSIPYLIAIIFDAGMSIKGFSMVVHGIFTDIALEIGLDGRILVVAPWVLIGMLSLALAILPEVILIDSD